MKKDKGAIEYSVSIILIMISVLVLLLCFRVRSARVEKAYLQDAQATANLAAAVIDTDLYGEKELLMIADPEEAFDQFKRSLKVNLNLDDSFMPVNTVFMESPVEILEFHIYNVGESSITHIRYDEYGAKSVEMLGLSGVTTPDGTEVESTTVYSKIEFDVKGFLGQRHRMTLENSVDVIKN